MKNNKSKSNIKNIIKKIKEDFLFTPITIVIGILFFALFIWTVKDLMIDSLWGTLFFLVIFFMPCIYYFIITKDILKNKKDKQKRNTETLISIILIIAFMLYYAVFSIIYIVILVENPTTNIKSYKKVVSNSLTDVFPREIPENVQDVKFYYSPAFLQAGTEIVLYYKDTDKNINDYINKFNKSAIWRGTFNDGYNKDNFSLESLRNGSNFINIPNDDFIIYLFDTNCDDTSWCNHGRYKAVLINDKTNEIVFSFEEW